MCDELDEVTGYDGICKFKDEERVPVPSISKIRFNSERLEDKNIIDKDKSLRIEEEIKILGDGSSLDFDESKKLPPSFFGKRKKGKK
jgi:hypothetical protein